MIPYNISSQGGMMASVCVEDGFKLDVHRMVAGRLKAGATRFSGRWEWTRNGERTANICYTVERSDEDSARMTLRYCVNGEPVEYSFRLVGLPCRFGGLRWQAICPHTLRRVAKLYLPPGARHFYARQAWHLAYRSQNVSAGLDRLSYRRDRYLWRKLQSLDPDVPEKPKGMRWATFRRHLAKLDAIEAEWELAFLQRFAALGGLTL